MMNLWFSDGTTTTSNNDTSVMIESLNSRLQKMREKEAATPTTTTTSNNDTSMMMESLNSRFQQMRDRERVLPVVGWGHMFPHQVIRMQSTKAETIRFVRHCLERESPYFGISRRARLMGGEEILLPRTVSKLRLLKLLRLLVNQ